MGRTARLPLALLAASLVMAISTSTAFAEEEYLFEVTPGGRVTATSLGKLTFRSSLATLQCNVTFTGTLETFAWPIVGAQAGGFERVAWANCEGGEIRAVLSLPWTLRYTSPLGTLPERMTGVGLSLEGAAVQFSIFFGIVNCLYRGAIPLLAPVTATREAGVYEIGLLRAGSETVLRYTSGPESCPESVSVAGTLALAAAQKVKAKGVGKLEATPHELTIPAGEVEKEFKLRNIGKGAVEEFGIVEVLTVGAVQITPEAACMPLAVNAECMVKVKPTMRPANGTLVVSYKIAPPNHRRTVSVDIEAP